MMKVLDDKNVSVASMNKDNRGRNLGLDKEAVKKSVELKNNINKVTQLLEVGFIEAEQNAG